MVTVCGLQIKEYVRYLTLTKHPAITLPCDIFIFDMNNVGFDEDDEGIEEEEEVEAESSQTSPLQVCSKRMASGCVNSQETASIFCMQPLRKNLRVLRFMAFPLYFMDDFHLGKKRFFGFVIAAQAR